MVLIDIIGLVRPSEETMVEHLGIIEAIEKRDPDLAESLIKSHLDISRQLILKKLDEDG